MTEKGSMKYYLIAAPLHKGNFLLTTFIRAFVSRLSMRR